MKSKPLISLEEALSPFPIRCTKCEGQATAYPAGTFCPRCSPRWTGAFMLHLLNVEREKHGLARIES